MSRSRGTPQLSAPASLYHVWDRVGAAGRGHPKRTESLIPFRTFHQGQHSNEGKNELLQIPEAEGDGGTRGASVEPETAGWALKQ